MNASRFHHCNIHNARLFLNNQQFPYEQINLNVTKNNEAIAYEMF